MIDGTLTLGYDLDAWTRFGIKESITLNLSPAVNSHIILTGLSGGGKSHAVQYLMRQLYETQPQGEIYCGDYKSDDCLSHLRECPRYYTYKDTLTALDIVHTRLIARQSGEDTSRTPITLVWDEYMAQILALLSEDKKAASAAMGKVAEILLLGRSLAVRLVISCQRPDALAFPAGSRLNYGVVMIVGGGSANRSIYEMLIPDFMEEVKGRQFGRGEGVVVLQGAQMRFIKVPAIRDEAHMKAICKEALS